MPPITRRAFDAVHALKEAEICNLALGRIGVDPMTDTDEDSKASRACKAAYSFARDKTLKAYPFNFAVRASMIPEDVVYPYSRNGYLYVYKTEDRIPFNGASTTTNQITGIDPLILDQSWVGRFVYGQGVPTDANIVAVDTVAGAITLDRPTTEAATSFTCGLPVLSPISVGGNKDNQYELVGGGSGARIFTDIVSRSLTTGRYCEMKYIRRVINPDEFDPSFTDALVVRIAYEICLNLTKNGGMFQSLQAEFYRLLAEAKRISSKEKQLVSADTEWTDRSGESAAPISQARR